MLGAFIVGLGTPEDIRFGELADPEPGYGQVRVAVSATTVNHVDALIRSGALPTELTFPFPVGRDALGTVDAVGDGVSGFTVGERVWTNSMGHDGRPGTAAEFVVVPVERLYHLPDGVGNEAVTVLHPGATAAMGLLMHGQARAGETVLVVGGAGNVGSAAVTIAASAGARVIAVASADDATYCESVGAERVIDPGELADADLPAIDVWLDAAGVNDIPRALGALAQRGRIVILAGLGTHSTLATGTLYAKDASVIGFTMSHATTAELSAASLTVNTLMADGVLASRRIERMPLSETAQAHRMLEDGRLGGARVLLAVH
jgi:2-desacetyl-2-hydroxyethyl bacteriochlorophyllide A dehydrogenase